MIELVPTTLDDPVLAAMFRALDDEIIATAAPGTTHFLHVDGDATDGGGVVLVARLAGVARGCAVLRPIDPTAAEVKRMWVEPDVRGRGVGAALLDGLLAHARSIGFDEVRLETDITLQQAVSLYERRGFRPCPAWGEYLDAPDSLCMAVRLD